MKKTFFLPAILLITLIINSVSAQALYVAGSDYEVLPDKNQLSLTVPGQKEVIEFFSYTCPHCYNVEKPLKEWKEKGLPADTKFYNVHATGGNWNFPAKAMLTAKKLGVIADFHDKYFNEIFVEKNRGVAANKKILSKFIEKKFDITQDDFNKAFDSFAVKQELKKISNKFRKAGLNSTPTFIVNGKFKVSLSNPKRTFDIIEFLLKTSEI